MVATEPRRLRKKSYRSPEPLGIGASAESVPTRHSSTFEQSIARDATSSASQNSPPALPPDDSACPGELLFKIRRTWRIAAIAHRFKRLFDLAERGLSHGGVPPPLGNKHQRDTVVAKARGPIQGRALAGPFFQRLAIGNNCLFELRRPALAFPEKLQSNTQIILGLGPLE